MSDEAWNIKYPTKPRSEMALSTKNGEVNLLGELTKQECPEDRLTAFKDFQVGQLKQYEVTSQGVKTVNGRKIAFIKFNSKAIDKDVFNYYFFTIVDGKVLFFTFNASEKEKKSWEKAADKILSSIKVK